MSNWWLNDLVYWNCICHVSLKFIWSIYLSSLLVQQWLITVYCPLREEAGVQSPINLESMSDRIKIREAMDQGNIDLVTQMINDFDPELLDMKPTLYFHLQQQKLIELIRSSGLLHTFTWLLFVREITRHWIVKFNFYFEKGVIKCVDIVKNINVNKIVAHLSSW